MTDDPLVWARRQRLKNAVRVLVVGLVIALAGAGYWYMNRDWAQLQIQGTPVMVRGGSSDPRIVAGAALAVGGLLALAGILLIARAGRTPNVADAD
jgi:hypothetical protein